MNSIEKKIQEIAAGFVHEIVKALVSSSIQEFAHLAYSEKKAKAPAAPKAPPAAKGRPKGSTKAAKAAKAEPKAKAAKKAAPPSKRTRRSSDDVQALSDKVIAYVESHTDGVAISDIAKGLRVDPNDVTRPISIALKSNRIYKTGEKRKTRYFPGPEPKG